MAKGGAAMLYATNYLSLYCHMDALHNPYSRHDVQHQPFSVGVQEISVPSFHMPAAPACCSARLVWSLGY